MALKRIMGTETEYGIMGGNANAVVQAYRGKAKGHENLQATNTSILPGMTDIGGHVGGDYGSIAEQMQEVEEDGPSNGVLGGLASRFNRVVSGGVSRFLSGLPSVTVNSSFIPDDVLNNGARFYVDMDHPEYSTAETSNPRDLVIADKAGERIVLSGAQAVGAQVKIYKNNTDGQGNSYGCHENYLLQRLTPEEFAKVLVPGLLPFFVTRQIYAGSGKIGVEEARSFSTFSYGGYGSSSYGSDWLRSLGSGKEVKSASNFMNAFERQRDRALRELDDLSKYFSDIPDFQEVEKLLRQMAKLRESKGEPQIYQLSQRGDFFEELVGLQTTHNRPIINTRDEPHADRQKYMRLHVICGDANLSEVSTYLKTGTTALVLDLLEDGLLPEIALDNPLKTIQNISRDQTRRWTVDLKEGKKTTALEVQRAYLQAAKDAYYGRDGITDDVLSRWETTLNALETDPMQLAGSIDWVIKLNLLTHMMDRHGVNMNDAKIKTAALQYHDIDPSKGLFYYLQNHEMAERLVTDAEIEHAMTHGPLDTRAYLRSRVASIPEVSSVDWGGFSLRVGNSTKSISLDEPFSGREEQVRVLLDHYSGPEGLLEGLKQVEGISVSDYVFTSPAGKKGKKSRKGRGKGTSTSFPTPFDRSYGDEEIGFTGMPDRIGEWDPDIEDRLRR